MSGYCPDCGNTLCVCSELDHDEQSNPSIKDEYITENSITLGVLNIYKYIDLFTDVEGLRNAFKIIVSQDVERLKELEAQLAKAVEVIEWYSDKDEDGLYRSGRRAREFLAELKESRSE